MILPLDPNLDDPLFDAIKPGWIPFLMVLGMLVIIGLLFFSMRRHLRKIQFVEEPRAGEQPTSREARNE